jgi:hypothetical protein
MAPMIATERLWRMTRPGLEPVARCKLATNAWCGGQQAEIRLVARAFELMIANSILTFSRSPIGSKLMKFKKCKLRGGAHPFRG